MASGLIAPRNKLVLSRGYRKPVNPVLDINHPFSKGLVGCWLLGDQGLKTSSANFLFVDISPNANHGTLINNGLSTVASHHGGTATNTPGSGNQGVTVPAISALNLTNFTIGGWARITGGSGSFRTIFAKSNNQTTLRSFDLSARSGNVWGTYFTQGGTFKGFDGSIAVGTNTWTHVVTTYDGATLRLFVDGVADGTAAATGAPDFSTNAATIGVLGPSGAELFVGDLEGIRAWNRALSQQEVLTWNAEPYIGIFDRSIPYRIGAGGGSDVTIALTGISATASPGSIVKTSLFTVPLIGIGASAAAGTLGKSSLITRGISGAAATVAAGSIAPVRSFGITGIAATASPGSIVKTSLFTVPLTGIGATAAAGSVAYSAGSDLSLSITGNSASVAAGTLGKASLIAIGLSGAAAAAAAGSIATVRSVGIIGAAGTVSPGSIAKTNLFTVPLVGNAATALPGNVGATGDKTIVIIGTAMTATAGSIAVAGADFWHPVIPGVATWTPQASASQTWTPL
ncbi:MAG TPA: LamG domain-containing protein [Rhizomicrobium sp.]|nr:LamG domain-containing protein [Rhizomicrobium sp.]